MELSAQSEVVRDDLIAVDAMHQLTDQLEQSVSAGRGPSIFPSVVTALDELADSLRSGERIAKSRRLMDKMRNGSHLVAHHYPPHLSCSCDISRPMLEIKRQTSPCK